MKGITQVTDFFKNLTFDVQKAIYADDPNDRKQAIIDILKGFSDQGMLKSVYAKAIAKLVKTIKPPAETEENGQS